MATKQLLYGSVGIGTIFTETLGNNQFIRLNGNTTSGSPTITNVADNGVNYFGVAELKVGMKLISGGPFGTKVTVTNVSGTTPNATVTVDSNAASTTTGNLLRVDPGPGQAFIESGSLAFPSGQSDINASSVTGSNDSQYVADDLQWAIAVPVAKDGNLSTQRLGQFAQFSLFDVQSRPGGATGAQANIFVTSSGGDMNGFPDGFDWYSNTSQCILYQIGDKNQAGPTFQGSDASISNAFGFAPGQVVASNLLDALTSGSSGGAAFPFTGSAEISGSIDMTGSFTSLLNTNENFLIKNALATSQSLFQIDNEGTAIFRAREGSDGAPSAVVGGLYFTTSSAFIGLDGV